MEGKMGRIGVRELKQRANEILRQVREQKESFAITYRGQVVARLVPAEDAGADRERSRAVWANMNALAEEIGRRWDVKVSATEAIQEQRREL
jgi:prevent-host-death family protein